MLVSTRSRYGLKIMYELAVRYGGDPVFLKDIARAHRISAKYLSKLVIPLRGARLITSFRGAHGGYALTRDPGTISLLEIVQALEGEIATTRQPRKRADAEGGSIHPADGVWTGLERTINEALGKVSLESLVNQAREIVLNYQI